MRLSTRLKEVANIHYVDVRQANSDYEGSGELSFTPHYRTRFGNHLFQMACLLSIQDKNKSFKIVPSISKSDRDGRFFTDWNNVFKKDLVDHHSERLENEYDVVVQEHFMTSGAVIYQKLPVFPNKRVFYNVLCYSYKYFEDTDIRSCFAFNDAITDYVKEKYDNLLKYKTASIHIRRTDKLQKRFENHWWGCSPKYYKTALSMMKDIEKVVVFSDDIEWCKKEFKGDRFVFIEGESQYADLYLMSLIQNNIISVSTFSWWGAYSNQNKDKRVICPAYYYKKINEEEDAYFNKKYHYPDSWTPIDNRR